MEFRLGNYTADIYRTEPISTIGDYDYDFNRRFISSYFNHLDIYDPIVKNKLIELVFPDDTVQDIRYAILELCDNLGIDNNDIGKYQSITIQLPMNRIFQIGNINFSRLDNGNISMNISFMKTQYNSPFGINIELTEQDVSELYTALDMVY